MTRHPHASWLLAGAQISRLKWIA